MTLDLVPWRGHNVPVFPADEIERAAFFSSWTGLINNADSGYPGVIPVQTTWRTRPVEPIPNDLIGYVEGMLYADGVVASVEQTRLRMFSQVPLLFQEYRNGTPGDFYDDDSLDLLRRPWPGGTTSDLMKRELLYADFAGNSYKILDEGEVVVLRPDWVQIVLEPRMIGGYQVGFRQVGICYYEGGANMGGADCAVFLRGEYSHFAPQPDPLASYRGMSWLTPIVREVQSDIATTEHGKAYMANAATPNLAVSLPKEVQPEQFNAFVEKMDSKHKGPRQAGRTLYTGGGADVTVIGANMQQMDYTRVQGKLETRIANAAGVHPVLVGLSEGMQGSSLNAGNYSAAKRSTVDITFRDLWQDYCGSSEQLFEPPKKNSRLWYQTRDTALLHEDASDAAQIQQTKASTVNTYITAGFKPDTAVAAVDADDMKLLEHTGLTSVQLMAPGSDANGDGAPDDTASADVENAAGDEYAQALDEFRSELFDEWEIARGHIDDDDDDEPGQFDVIERKYYDVRNYHGRFRKKSDEFGHALNEWLNGDGGDGDPIERLLSDLPADTPAGRTARQRRLKTVAKDFGIAVPPRAGEKALKLAIFNDAKARHKAKSSEPSRRASFTLKGKDHRDLDVGVYVESKPGSRIYLRRESDGKPGTTLASFDDLDAMASWADQHGESELGRWARLESTGDAPKTDRVVAPSRTEKALTTAEAKKAREIEVENKIRAAYRDLPEQKTVGVEMADLRERSDLSREEFDAAIGRMVRGDGAFGYAQENQQRLTPRDRESAVKVGSRTYHRFKLDDPSDRTAPSRTSKALDTAEAKQAGGPAKGEDVLDHVPLSLLSNLERPRGAKRPSPDEVAAFDAYGDDGQAINARLRAGRRATPATRQMDAAMARSPLSADVELWRGVSGGSDLGFDLDGDVTGAEFTDKAFVSTTVRRDVAERFASLPGSGPKVVVRIAAPKGTHAVAFSGAGGITESQGELLLERGLTFRVTADRGDVDGIRHLDVEIVPTPAKKAAPSRTVPFVPGADPRDTRHPDAGPRKRYRELRSSVLHEAGHDFSDLDDDDMRDLRGYIVNDPRRDRLADGALSAVDKEIRARKAAAKKATPAKTAAPRKATPKAAANGGFDLDAMASSLGGQDAFADGDSNYFAEAQRDLTSGSSPSDVADRLNEREHEVAAAGPFDDDGRLPPEREALARRLNMLALKLRSSDPKTKEREAAQAADRRRFEEIQKNAGTGFRWGTTRAEGAASDARDRWLRGEDGQEIAADLRRRAIELDLRGQRGDLTSDHEMTGVLLHGQRTRDRAAISDAKGLVRLADAIDSAAPLRPTTSPAAKKAPAKKAAAIPDLAELQSLDTEARRQRGLKAGLPERQAGRFAESGMTLTAWRRASKSSTPIVPTPTPANPQSPWGQIRDAPTVTWSAANGRPGFYDQVDRVYTAKSREEAREFLQTRSDDQLDQIAESGMVDLPPGPGRAERIERVLDGIREPESGGASDLSSLDTEARRDALDMVKVGSVDEPGTLKAMLRARGLPVSGNKRALVDRLVSGMDAARSVEPDHDIERAAGHDVTPGHDNLHHYWTVGEGLVRWSTWTELYDQLAAIPEVGPLKARVYASDWFRDRYGFSAGSDLNRVKNGKPPRGGRVGPG